MTERPGQAPRALDIQKPLGTLVSGGKHALVAAHVAKHNGGHEATGTAPDAPLHTVTTRDHHALVSTFLTKFYGTSTGSQMDLPIGQGPQLPLATVTAHDRFGLVYVHGEPYAIVDIGMRMLSPRELFRAQGFPDSYKIDVPVTKTNKHGKVRTAPLTKTAQIRMVGNSVCPPIAAALVVANVTLWEEVA